MKTKNMDVEIRTRIDRKTKKQAEKIFHKSGLTMSQALRLFLAESVRQEAIAIRFKNLYENESFL